MPNFYKKKHPEKIINEENMEKALSDIKNKIETSSSASKKYDIKRTTILSRIKKQEHNSGLSKEYQSKFSSNQVLTAAQEKELANYFKKCSNLHHGLSYDLARRFVYEYVRRNNLKRPEKWDTEKQAGKDWLKCFMNRNPDISLRKPENTSIARIFGFSKAAVEDFFLNLKTVLTKHNFTPDRIYNIDETGISTVLDSPKVISEKGKRTVSQAASAERGSLVTMVAIINASGNHIPPVYVFPRKRMNPNFLKDCIPGSQALLAKNGWMNADLFESVLAHIQKNARCSKDDPILLLMDNHASHCGLDSILYCRDNGICLLSFPPHTSHKLQPLDVCVFGPFKKFCKQSFNNFIVNNPGMKIDLTDIAHLTKTPFMRAFSSENVIKAFSSTGIFPYNDLIFPESDFSQSDTVAESSITNTTEAISFQPDVSLPTSQLISQQLEPPSPSHIASEETILVSKQSAILSPEIIRPLPKVLKRKAMLKNQGKSRIYTDSPEKTRIEELRKKKNEKPQRKQTSKVQTKKPKKTSIKKSIVMDSTSSSSSEVFSLADSDKSFNISEESTEFPEISGIGTNVTIKEDDFVLVKFTDKTDFYYIGLVTEVNVSACVVKFLRRLRKTQYFVEPLIEDRSLVLRQDIVSILPAPAHPAGTSRAKAKFMFSLNFANYDVR